MMKKRVEWIDVLKCFCMFFVIASHWEGCPKFFSYFFSPFFLTCFFFASGYCYNHSFSFKDHLYKKFRTLFIPWFVFSYANIFLSKLVSFKEHKNFIYEIVMNAMQIRSVDDKLWFIACLFIAYIPFYFIIKEYKNNNQNINKIFWLLLSITLGIRIFKLICRIKGFDYIWGNTNLPWHLEYIAEVNLYLYLGYLFKEKYELLFDAKNTISKRLFLLLIYMVIIYIPIYFGLNQSYIVKEIFDIFSIIVGTVLAISIFKILKINTFFQFVGKNTLIYFSWHNKVLTLLEVLSSKLLGVYYVNAISTPIFAFFLTIIVTLIISTVLILPAIIINRYFYFILGKKATCE